MNKQQNNQNPQEIPLCRIMSSDEWLHEYYSNPESLMPIKRKDDRRLPGIVTGWATDFSEEYFSWRVWDGTVQREDHHTKDRIWGYWESSQEIAQIENSCGVCIVYPEGKPESEFVEWANSQAALFMEEYHRHELGDPVPDASGDVHQPENKIREVKS